MVRQVVHRLADTGVRVLDVELARIGPDDEPDRFVEVLEAAAAVGARHVIGQLPDPDRARATDHFGRLCDLALDFGLTVDLEFPSWSATGDLAAAAAVVRAVDQANAGILVDALHFFRSHSSLDELTAAPRTLVPLRPAVRRTRHGPRRPSTASSTPPGRRGRSPATAASRSRQLLDQLPAGPYSLEVPNDVLRRELGTAEFARLVLTVARAIVAGHGQPAVAR